MYFDITAGIGLTGKAPAVFKLLSGENLALDSGRLGDDSRAYF
jgi:hypothetical protein